MILTQAMFRVLLLAVMMSGCATDLSYETDRVWCVGACVIEHTQTVRHSETTRKSEKSEESDK